jgi:hypothetical protein
MTNACARSSKQSNMPSHRSQGLHAGAFWCSVWAKQNAAGCIAVIAMLGNRQSSLGWPYTKIQNHRQQSTLRTPLTLTANTRKMCVAWLQLILPWPLLLSPLLRLLHSSVLLLPAPPH